MRLRIGKNPAAVRMTTAQEYSGFSFEKLEAPGKFRLSMRHGTGEQVWLDFDSSEAIALYASLRAALGPTPNTRTRELAREMVNRSRDEEECNTIEDAVELAKLVLGLAV